MCNPVFPNPLIGEAATGATSWLITAGTHIAFGVVGLFYPIKKFFEEVEKSLNEQTEARNRYLGVGFAPNSNYPQLAVNVLDHV